MASGLAPGAGSAEAAGRSPAIAEPVGPPLGRAEIAGPARAVDVVEAISAIDAVLPQTQCRQCGYDGCRPYAAAIAAGTADIDRCPPGGDAGVAKLSRVTGRPVVPLDSRRGTPKPLLRAVIDEALCIGCTLCIQACPVDAIVGGAKRMHDVVPDLCTGCELCLPPCPVDCIALVPAGVAWTDADAASARVRHVARARRLARGRAGAAAAPSFDAAAAERVRAAPAPAGPASSAESRRRAIVDAAVVRARALPRRRASPPATDDAR